MKNTRFKKRKISFLHILGIGLILFLSVATIFGVLAKDSVFDIRNYAKGPKKEEKKRGDQKVTCPTACDGKYKWVFDRASNTCKKRIAKDCETAGPAKATCSGSCVSASSCGAVNMRPVGGDCMKKDTICCTKTAAPVTTPENNTSANIPPNGGSNQILEEPPAAPTPTCTLKGWCITGPYGCCAGSSPVHDQSCSTTARCQ